MKVIYDPNFFIISFATVVLSYSKVQVTDLGAKSPVMAKLPQSGTNKFFSSFHLLLQYFYRAKCKCRSRWQKFSYGQITSKWHQHGFFIISPSSLVLSQSKVQVTDLGGKSPVMAKLPQSDTNMGFSSFHPLLQYFHRANYK